METYLTDKTLSTSLLISNIMEVYYLFEAQKPRRIDLKNRAQVREAIARLEIHLDVEAINEALKDFEATVWFGGLQAIVRGTRHRHVGAKAGTLKVASWTMAGRTMITLSDSSLPDLHGDKHVTLVADETSTEPRSGLHGINATAAEAIQLFKQAVQEFEAGNLKFVTEDI